ncbi:hypothetical protein ANCDUO_17907 [Ancylostoma duodenale]|uniref:Uncharacterized protein n=1 Tax=Ancylostoma duodenale TaxID=51022 RepID=A0A0C2FZ98_9BILA|nr:hypothetical protein ANCDUO_17907 [Ancylostoma duodenale]
MLQYGRETTGKVTPDGFRVVSYYAMDNAFMMSKLMASYGDVKLTNYAHGLATPPLQGSRMSLTSRYCLVPTATHLRRTDPLHSTRTDPNLQCSLHQRSCIDRPGRDASQQDSRSTRD